MIKHDYGKLSSPFYEEKLKSGLNVIFIPKESKIHGAILYIPQGYYLHDETIANSKISYGCPYLLKEMILNDETKRKIEEKGCKVTSICKHSYTYYKFESLSSITDSINILLDRIRNLEISDDEVEKYKKIIISNIKESDVDIAKDNTLKNMFFNSPMKKGTRVKASDLKKIHLSEMKKFLYKYYSLKSMTLFISGNYTNKIVANSIKDLRFPVFPIVRSTELKFEEDYSSVVEKRDVIYLKDTRNILTLGIKLDERKKLFEKFGELTFIFYEIVKDMIVENENFKKMLKESHSKLLDFDIIEGYEDTAFLLTFETEKFASLSNNLSTFLSSIEKNISTSFYTYIKNNYHYKCKKDLASPSLLLDDFARVYADNLPFTYVVRGVNNLSKADFNKMLSSLLSYPRSVTYLQKEGKAL